MVRQPHIFLFSVHKDAMDAAVRAFAADWPQARVSNLLDDSRFACIRDAGGVVPGMHEGFKNLTRHMVDRGADGILFQEITLSFRLVVRCAFIAAALSAPAHAQQYPTKVIRLVVPFAPGGPNDILGRLVGHKLTQQWGQPVVVENRGGAGGTIGLDHAAKLPADGYSIAMGGSSNLAVAPSLYKKLPYDPRKDFSAIINVAHVPYALAVNPTVPAKNVRELIVLANRKKDYLSYGSSGAGAMSHLAAELLKSMSKTSIVHVPYKGTAPALMDVIAGNIDMMLADLALIQPLAAAGKLKVLGVAGSKRLPGAPNVPTIGESGLKGYVIEPWFGVVGPAGIPKNIVAALNAAIAGSLKSPDVLQRLGTLGYEPIGGTPEQFSATITADIANYARIVKAAGIVVEK